MLDITSHIDNNYLNASGELIVITHVTVTYHVPEHDHKLHRIMPIEKANEFASQNGIYGAYVSAIYDKEEAIEKGFLTEVK